MTEHPKGLLFSRLYVEKGTLLPDSKRFRIRIGEFYRGQLYGHAVSDELKICHLIESELGIKLRFELHGRSLPTFFVSSEIRDVLSAITLVYQFLQSVQRRAEGQYPLYKHAVDALKRWPEFVERVFQEENLAYKLDKLCGVHPLRDIEYQHNVAATIAGLDNPRYAAVRAAFEAARDKLEQILPDTKGAIRDAFEATETLTKLITASGKALDSGFVKSEIQPRVQKLYESDSVAKMTGARAAESFADWVNAAHPYRHGHEAEEPVRLPLELAILLLSQAASFIRWLADLDQQLPESKAAK